MTILIKNEYIHIIMYGARPVNYLIKFFNIFICVTDKIEYTNKNCVRMNKSHFYD